MKRMYLFLEGSEKNGGRKSSRFSLPDSASNGGSGSGNSRDDASVELVLLAKGLEQKSSFASSAVRNASSRIRLVSLEIKPAVARALMGLKFISKTDGGVGWAAVEKRFDGLTASTNGLLPRTVFGECIGMNKESKEFAVELFDALARRRNILGDSINKTQLKEFWDQIADQSFDSRLQTFFDMVDKDADGRITEDEVREIISLSASANKLSNIQKQANEYAALIMEELDPNNKGYILIENLKMLLLQGPDQSIRGSECRNLSRMLSQKLKPSTDPNPIRRWSQPIRRWFQPLRGLSQSIRRWSQDLKCFLLDNWQRAWVILLWIGVMAGLFAYKYVQFKRRAVYDVMGPCVCMAKGAAETLKLNMALILLPVCRNTITWLRNKTKLGAAVPFGDNLNFHKVIAVAIAIGVGVHGISHLACDFPRLLNASPEKYGPMIPFFGEQPTSYWHFVKSWEGITGIIMVVLMAIAFTLATPWFWRNDVNLPKPFNKLTGFNAFWYSHHLFIIIYTLLIIHGVKFYLNHKWYKKTTWMYLAIPITIYACERMTRALRSSIKPVKILKVAVYPGNVLALHLSKPQGFKYTSGQYMFVKCPAVSPFEWHPFSINSVPGDDHLSVHVSTLGDWTRQLRTVFSEICQPPPTGKSGLLTAHCLLGENTPNFPRVLIDGPYGAPAPDYKKYEVVLLVGLDTGATPMISIMKDIVNNMKAIEEDENSLGTGNRSPLPANASLSTHKRKSGPGSGSGGNFKTKRAYLHCVTREQGSFDWFKRTMNEVAEMDPKGVIEMHSYCTSAYAEGDARSALVSMIQSLNRAKNGVDIISGTRVKSHFAKPNWRNVYKSIALNHTNAKVGVFCCGAPALTKELRQLALDFSHKTSTKFDFHKENF